MAPYLYRLGHFAARRPWLVVVGWLAVLALVLGGAVGLGRPFTSKMTIPGTEFQQVLDDLEAGLPKAAGGIGTVVLRTEDGTPFTEAQRKTVADLTKRWSDIDGVDTAADPFATQAQLDDGAKQVAEGRAKLDAGQREMEANAKKIADGRAKLKEGEDQLKASAPQLDEGQKKIDEGQKKLDAGQAEYDAGAAKLADGERQWAAGKAELDAGTAKVREAKSQIDTQQQQIDAGRAELAPKLAQLPTMKQQMAGLQAQLATLPPGDPQAPVLQEQINALQAGIAQIEAANQKLNDGQSALNAAKAQLAPKLAEADAGAEKLSATRAELDAGQAKLAQSKTQLDTGRSQLEASKKELADGKAKAEKAKADLEKAKADLDAGEKALNDAKADLPAGKNRLELAERRLALMKGLRAVNTRGDVAVTQLMFDKPINEVAPATRDAVPAAAGDLSGAGIVVDYSKEIGQKIEVAGPGELLGLIVAGLVLLVMLGSLLAAGLPLLTAMIGVGVGLLGAVMLTHWIEMTDVTPSLALMLGLAVGIDYSLFLVNRHREQLARGQELRDSIARATGTAGGAVVFAGLTVVVALSALSLTRIPFLGIMGFAAAATVTVAVLVAITLTPALLSLMGHRVLSVAARRALRAELDAGEAEAADEDASAREGADAVRNLLGLAPAGADDEPEAPHGATETPHGATETPHDPHRGHGWGGLVTRHPWVALAAATALLGVLAVPAASLRLGLPDGSYEPHDSSAYRAYDTISREFGPGRGGPIIAVAKLPEDKASSLSPDALTDLQLTVGEKMRRVPGVAYVVPAMASDDHRTLVYQVVPTSGPSDDATAQLVRDLRAARGDVQATTGLTSLGFAGQTVANIDISQSLADALPIYLTVVVGISLVLLLLVFRSVVVPVLATAGFLLSVAAAFGGLVAVYQWGHLAELFGVEHPGLVLSFLPTLVIGILFGLAMDYQMFLVSGMREAWAHGHTARAAVRQGFGHGARVVTAAALIMTAVFASFIHAPLTMIRPIGFTLAFGVLIDAFVVRMTAMPAIMHVLGERAWYLPPWLAKVLPELDIEGTSLEAAHPAVVDPAADPQTAVPAQADAATAAAGSVTAGSTAKGDAEAWPDTPVVDGGTRGGGATATGGEARGAGPASDTKVLPKA